MALPAIESREFWEQQLEKLKSSGLSRAKYCRENGINYDRFGYWLTRLRPATSPRFLPVKLHECHLETTLTPLCTLEIRGHVLKIYDVSALSFVLEKLAK
jgi:hypothetical protein